MQQAPKAASDRLVFPYSAKIKTISILDEFEKRNKHGDPIYHSLLLLECFDILKCELYSVSLVICRWDWRENFINEFTTFTRFKRLVGGKHFEPTTDKVPEVVRQILCSNISTGLVSFSPVVLLHAQNSGNRMGYGNSPTSRGARYGETCAYMFTEAILTRKDEDLCMKSGSM